MRGWLVRAMGEGTSVKRAGVKGSAGALKPGWWVKMIPEQRIRWWWWRCSCDLCKRFHCAPGSRVRHQSQMTELEDESWDGRAPRLAGFWGAGEPWRGLGYGWGSCLLFLSSLFNTLELWHHVGVRPGEDVWWVRAQTPFCQQQTLQETLFPVTVLVFFRPAHSLQRATASRRGPWKERVTFGPAVRERSGSEGSPDKPERSREEHVQHVIVYFDIYLNVARFLFELDTFTSSQASESYSNENIWAEKHDIPLDLLTTHWHDTTCDDGGETTAQFKWLHVDKVANHS